MTNLKLSYAQNFEDIILESYLSDVQKGFYIDVGANHPTRDSVTRIFYDKAWRGINIEPNAAMVKLLNIARPEDTNLNIGVGDRHGRLLFREYQNSGLSTFSTEIQKDLKKEDNPLTNNYREYEVDVVPLRDIFKEHANSKDIHFMKVDVEGYEYEVLKSNDWSLYRPYVLCIEANHIVHDWRPLIKEADYHFASEDGLNEYYIAKEQLPRLKKFSYPEVFLLGPLLINYRQQAVIDDLQHQIKLLNLDVSSTKHEFEHYKEHSMPLLNSYQLARELGRRINGVLTRQIDKLAVARHVEQPVSESGWVIRFPDLFYTPLPYRLVKRLYAIAWFFPKSLFRLIAKVGRAVRKGKV